MYNSVFFVILCYYPDVKLVASMIDQMQSKRVIVVDNTPASGLRRCFPKDRLAKNVTIIQTKKNLGFAGGMNKGMEFGLLNDADWIILLSQDIQAEFLNIDKFIRLLLHSKPGIYGPFAGRLDARRWTTMLPSSRVEYISGACMAIHRNVIEKIGYFYEPYFMYYEDVDFCIRAKKAGFPFVHIPADGIKHIDAPSLGKGSFLHEYYLARNHLLFVERMAPLRVKGYEYILLPKTILEYLYRRNYGALAGCKDYFMRRLGEKRVLWS